MRLLFAALLVEALFSGYQQRVKPLADDILSACIPACYAGASGMSVHQLYACPAPDHHNLYLIRRVPMVFFEPGPVGESVLRVRPTPAFVTNKLHAPCARWELAVLPRGMPPKTWSLTRPPIFPVHLSLHL